MKTPKTLREVRDFLNGIPENHLDRRFILQQENDIHHAHFLNVAQEDYFFDPECPENGCMTIQMWEESGEEFDKDSLKIGIPIGAPMIGEDF